MTREQIEKRMDELARLYAETHDEKVKEEFEELSRQLAQWTRAVAVGRRVERERGGVLQKVCLCEERFSPD